MKIKGVEIISVPLPDLLELVFQKESITEFQNAINVIQEVLTLSDFKFPKVSEKQKKAMIKSYTEVFPKKEHKVKIKGNNVTITFHVNAGCNGDWSDKATMSVFAFALLIKWIKK